MAGVRAPQCPGCPRPFPAGYLDNASGPLEGAGRRMGGSSHGTEVSSPARKVLGAAVGAPADRRAQKACRGTVRFFMLIFTPAPVRPPSSLSENGKTGRRPFLKWNSLPGPPSFWSMARTLHQEGWKEASSDYRSKRRPAQDRRMDRSAHEGPHPPRARPRGLDRGGRTPDRRSPEEALPSGSSDRRHRPGTRLRPWALAPALRHSLLSRKGRTTMKLPTIDWFGAVRQHPRQWLLLLQERKRHARQAIPALAGSHLSGQGASAAHER